METNFEYYAFKDGYAKFTAKYDGRGNTTEKLYFGVNGEPLELKLE